MQGAFIQGAADLLQVAAHQANVQIRYLRCKIRPVIKWNVRGDVKQLLFLFRGSLQCTAEFADVVKLRGLACLPAVHIQRCFIGSAVSARYPDHKDVDALKKNRLYDRIVQRFNAPAISDQVCHNAVDPLLRDSFDREYRRTILFFHTDKNISAPHVVNVICERADGVNDGIRVEIALEFDSGGFYDPSVQQVVYIDRDRHVSHLDNSIP